MAAMERVLITGGAGFIGTNAAARYLAMGREVIVFDNLSRPGAVHNLRWLEGHEGAENLRVIIGDLRLPEPTLLAAIERCDLILHLGGQVAVTTSVEDPVSDFEINARGTLNLLEMMRTSGGKRPALIYASTNKVYGGMEEVGTVERGMRFEYESLPFGVPERQRLDFHSPYGCSKGAADQYVRDYSRIYGLQTVVFRQSCVYGPRQFGVEDQGWVAWFVIAALLGKPITVFGNGKQVRDVLFVGDLLGAYDAAWSRIDERNGRIYNIGGGSANSISLLELLEHLEGEVGEGIPVGFEGWRPGDQPVYVSDIRRAERELGWIPETDWKHGVTQLVIWARENKEILRQVV
jgi:CDP-paratose 2-epimerase